MGKSFPGPQIGAIIRGISQVLDRQNEARPLGDLRRKGENCEKGPLVSILLRREPAENLQGYTRGLLQ